MKLYRLGLLGWMIVLLCCGCGQVHSASAPPAVSAPAPSQAAELSVLPEAAPVQGLTVARMENNRFVTEVINAFNDANTGVQAQSEWFNDREGELKLSLIAGDGPDLMSLEFFDYEIYAAKGVFTDLYPLLDADETLSRSDLVEPVLRAMEYRNGAL